MKIHEILEARMSPRAYQRSLKQVADETLVGFELEFLVPPGSLLDSSPATKADAAKIDGLSFADISRYFVVSSQDKQKIDREYHDWLEAEALDFIEQNYDSYMSDDIEESDAREMARQEYMEDHAPDEDTWVQSTLGSMRRFIKKYSLDPVYGVTPDGTEVLTGEPPDNKEKILGISKNVAEYLEQQLDIRVGITTNYSRWSVVEDNSVKDPERGSTGLELVSPPLPAATALDELGRVIEVLKKVTYTNQTTGLHVNISIGSPEKMQDLDLVKLVLFMGDSFVLDAFGRSTNTMTKSQVQNIRTAITNNASDINPGDIAALHKAAMSALSSSGKYMSVNINNLPKYLEFRAAGGEYYSKLPMIHEIVGRWLTAMHIAMDPQMYRKEYLKKLTGLLQSK